MEMKRFVGQAAVITGAANGIGHACATRFAEEGANIACLDLNTEANEATAAACRALAVDGSRFSSERSMARVIFSPTTAPMLPPIKRNSMAQAINGFSLMRPSPVSKASESPVCFSAFLSRSL